MPHRRKRHAPTVLCLVAVIVGCGDETTEPQSGNIRVNLAVSGAAPDGDGCLVSVDGGAAQRLLDGERHLFVGLSVGTHTVSIFEVASNCFVQGESSRSVAVGANEISSVQFALDCPVPPGSIEVNLNMTGAAPDSDGCVVSVDSIYSQLLLNGETHLFGDLSVGTHTVSISDVATNCSVQGGSSRSVTVNANEISSVQFALDCPVPPSGIEVATHTAGSTIDPDGYVVVLDGTTTRDIGTSDVETFTDLVGGQHDVELTGLAGSCGVVGANPVRVTVAENEVTTVDFGIACPPFYDHIAFTWDDIYVMEAEGSTPVNVSRHIELDGVAYLDWSPDGTRLAYRVYGNNGYDIEVLRVDGSAPFRIDLPDYFCVHSLEWSPVGELIIFIGGEDNHEVFAVETDGSNLLNLTNSDAEEWNSTWSPDGTQILFTAHDEDNGLYVMDADGSNATFLSEHTGGTDLQWSPDGNRVLYNGMCGTDAIFMQICSMDPDGSNPVALTDPPDDDWHPAWSPDGTRITFVGRRAETGIFVMNADGSDVSFLVEGGQPAWSPAQ